MKRSMLLFLCFALCLSLLGCQEETAPTTESVTLETETETVTEVTEPVWSGYSGPSSDYVYYYAEGRDQDWEEDVLFFADSHLTDNQLLRNRKFLVELPGLQTDSSNFYDEALHQAFLDGVNALIPEISALTDKEILYRIQMLSALFRDVHTSAYSGFEAVYPIFFHPFYEDGEFVYYAVILPKKNEKLLYTRLTAINDIPLDEIIERMRSYDSYENEYGFALDLGAGGYGNDLLSYPTTLEAVGVSEIGDTWAKYTLMDDEGNTYDLNMKATEEFNFAQCCGTSAGMALPIPYWYGSAEHYWYTTALGAGTLYVRIYSFSPEETESYMDLSNALNLESQAAGRFRKIILDLRGNHGGHQDVGWRSIINTLAAMEFDEFYILVDGSTYSNSMIFAAEVAYLIPEAVFAGSPTGEAPGFFAGMYEGDYIMPNCGVEFRIPTQYYQPFEANEENALIPDILIWPTIEDYVTSHDVVLEYVLTQ